MRLVHSFLKNDLLPSACEIKILEKQENNIILFIHYNKNTGGEIEDGFIHGIGFTLEVKLLHVSKKSFDTKLFQQYALEIILCISEK